MAAANNNNNNWRVQVNPRQRRRMVSYVGVGQSRFSDKIKRHLPHSCRKWRLILLLLAIAIALIAGAGIWRELSTIR